MKKLYIVDYIGVHCGMHYYDDVFLRHLQGRDAFSVRILSNYPSEGKRAFFPNFFRCNRFRGACGVALSYLKLWGFMLLHPRARFILLSYGDTIDLLFMSLALFFRRRMVIDVHEVYSLRRQASDRVSRLLLCLYRRCVVAAIVHSERSMQILQENGYRGRLFRVPHFKYCFKKTYDRGAIAADLESVYRPDCVNVLFFGNISYAKGIDRLLEATNSLVPEETARLHVVVAGKNADDAVYTIPNVHNGLYTNVIRHINDDELVFLYQHTDYVVLPYRQTTQSGVLEMAFYFQKPIIASDVPYFRTTLAQYPSFGLLCEQSPESLAAVLSRIQQPGFSPSFYTPADVEAYGEDREVSRFATELLTYLKNMN